MKFILSYVKEPRGTKAMQISEIVKRYLPLLGIYSPLDSKLVGRTIAVKFYEPGEAGAPPFGAHIEYADPSQGQMHDVISVVVCQEEEAVEENAFEVAKALLFELCNAANDSLKAARKPELALAMLQKASSDEDFAESYASLMEEAEHLSVRQHMALLMQLATPGSAVYSMLDKEDVQEIHVAAKKVLAADTHEKRMALVKEQRTAGGELSHYDYYRQGALEMARRFGEVSKPQSGASAAAAVAATQTESETKTASTSSAASSMVRMFKIIDAQGDREQASRAELIRATLANSYHEYSASVSRLEKLHAEAGVEHCKAKIKHRTSKAGSLEATTAQIEMDFYSKKMDELAVKIADHKKKLAEMEKQLTFAKVEERVYQERAQASTNEVLGRASQKGVFTGRDYTTTQGGASAAYQPR